MRASRRRIPCPHTYRPQGSDLDWEYALYASFVADLVLNFFFAYHDASGALVVDQRSIAANYARSWLILDVAATLPLEFVLPTDDASDRTNQLTRLARLPRALRLLRLLRLVKLARMDQIVKVLRWFKSDIHPAFLRLVTSLFWAALTLHLAAGAWFMLADSEDPTYPTWITFYGYDTANVRGVGRGMWCGRLLWTIVARGGGLQLAALPFAPPPRARVHPPAAVCRSSRSTLRRCTSRCRHSCPWASATSRLVRTWVRV